MGRAGNRWGKLRRTWWGQRQWGNGGCKIPDVVGTEVRGGEGNGGCKPTEVVGTEAVGNGGCKSSGCGGDRGQKR